MSADIDATLHDGRAARGQSVRVHREPGLLVARDGTQTWRWPVEQVIWPERTRHGRRVAQLPGGGMLSFEDAARFDAWHRAAGAPESRVVRVQQHWGAVVAVALAFLLLIGVAWRWGVPLAASGVLAVVPTSVDRSLGDAALASLQRETLHPSRVPVARQQQLRDALTAALARLGPPDEAVPWTLHFADAGSEIGPNAFALPGGHLVMTDALVTLLDDRDDALLGVLGHEVGHLRARHGMRGLVQAALVAMLASAVVGDFSSVLAGAPALLAQQGYSRDFEREADATAVQVLRAAGQSPLAMTVLFERLQARAAAEAKSPDDGSSRSDAGRGRAPDWLGIALASHPADEERMRFFREAASRP